MNEVNPAQGGVLVIYPEFKSQVVDKRRNSEDQSQAEKKYKDKPKIKFPMTFDEYVSHRQVYELTGSTIIGAATGLVTSAFTKSYKPAVAVGAAVTVAFYACHAVQSKAARYVKYMLEKRNFEKKVN